MEQRLVWLDGGTPAIVVIESAEPDPRRGGDRLLGRGRGRFGALATTGQAGQSQEQQRQPEGQISGDSGPCRLWQAVVAGPDELRLQGWSAWSIAAPRPALRPGVPVPTWFLGHRVIPGIKVVMRSRRPQIRLTPTRDWPPSVRWPAG